MQDIEKIKAEYKEVCEKIDVMNRKEANSYTSQVAKSFHLGRVGGSGRNTHRLNKRREREIERSIDNAMIQTKLCQQRDNLKKAIEYIESGQNVKDAERREKRDTAMIEYWKGLKPGDKLNIGNGDIEIKRKSKKSFTCTSGINWTAAEIIGKKLSDKL